jgi:hypothetical protein
VSLGLNSIADGWCGCDGMKLTGCSWNTGRISHKDWAATKSFPPRWEAGTFWIRVSASDVLLLRWSDFIRSLRCFWKSLHVTAEYWWSKGLLQPAYDNQNRSPEENTCYEWKAKLSLCTPWRREGDEVQLHSCLTSAAGGTGCSVSCIDRLAPLTWPPICFE